ncbi:MAG: hypothetical protein HKN17_06305, partial [Rhodothermales bacterium]|nr:hypothetical protein [Rhodothermales bacterium]
NHVWKVPTGGGPAVSIGPNCFFPVFLDNERFICEQGWNQGSIRGLYLRDIDGQSSELIIRRDSTSGSDGVSATSVLPGGRFAVGMVDTAEGDFLSFYDLRQGSIRVLPQSGSFPRYVASGHLVYIDGPALPGVLMARPFDAVAGRFTGPAAPIVGEPLGWRDFDVTRSGILVLGANALQTDLSELAWYSVDGSRLDRLPVEPNFFDNPAISPDGRLLAVEIEGAAEEDTWVIDVETGTEYRWSFTGDGNFPAWSADGTLIYISSDDDANDIEEGLLVKPADNSGVMRLAFDDAKLIVSPHVARNGSRIVYADMTTGGIRIRSLANPDSMREIVRGEDLRSPALSPDGAYVAFMTTEQESNEIYVQQSEGDAFWTVSIPDNMNPDRPMWSPDGEWLYYRDGGQLWRSRVSFTPTFSRDRPEMVLEVPVGNIDFDLHPDGERILINSLPPGLQSEEQYQVRLSVRMHLQHFLSDVAPSTE